MRNRRYLLCFLLFLFLIGLPYPARARTSADPNRAALKGLIEDLQKAINDADRRMIAHPRFLDELRVLVRKYRRRLRDVYLEETFSDGNYTKNPRWVVTAGRFRLTPDHRLYSHVPAERPVASSREEGEEEPIGLILKEILRSGKKKKQKKQSVPQQKTCAIRTLTRIGPLFEVDITVMSDSSWGAMEVVLLGGKSAVPYYRLVYQPAPSPERPIQIIRQRGSRRYIIESATRYPNLDDGSPHRIQWTRDNEGHMRVLVDGREVLSTVEVFYRKDFAGIALINRGGTYEWGPIRVLQAKVPEKP